MNATTLLPDIPPPSLDLATDGRFVILLVVAVVLLSAMVWWWGKQGKR